MYLSFVLSMPHNNSWNGKWTGENNYYAVVRRFSNTLKFKEKAKKILEEERFTYDFGDGWVAAVTVSKVTAQEARKIRKKSQGFCGYEWMIDSVLQNMEIIACKTLRI